MIVLCKVSNTFQSKKHQQSIKQKTTTFPRLDSKSFNWQGGDNKLYTVIFINKSKTEELSNDALNNAILGIMSKSRKVIEENYSYYTFVPDKLSIYGGLDGKVKACSEYRGINKSLGEIEIVTYFDFDMQGRTEFLFHE